MADRRTTLADAALTVVADHGLKGLTHRAVDREASVPPGTTSNYFRTRAALIGAVIDRLEQRDLEVWAAGGGGTPATTPDELAQQLARYLGALAGAHADLARTRFSLSIDRPEDVAEGHRRFLALAEHTIAEHGARRCAAPRTLGRRLRRRRAPAPGHRTTRRGPRRHRDRGRHPSPARLSVDYSHSMVPGGFDVTSSTTRLTSRTSFVMRFEILASTS